MDCGLVYRAEARRRRAKDGGPDRDRTGDLMNAIHARSQLRYRPTLERVNPNGNAPGRQGQTSGTAQVLLEKAFPGVGTFASSGRPLLWQSTEKFHDPCVDDWLGEQKKMAPGVGRLSAWRRGGRGTGAQTPGTGELPSRHCRTPSDRFIPPTQLRLRRDATRTETRRTGTGERRVGESV